MFTIDDDKKNGQKLEEKTPNYVDLNKEKPATASESEENPIENRILTDNEYREKRLLYGNLSPDDFAKEKFNLYHKKMYLYPDYTPKKRMVDYARSEGAAKDIVDTFYMENIKPLYEGYRKDLVEKGKSTFRKTVSTPGLNSYNAMTMQVKEQDPMKAVEKSLETMDMDKLKESVEPLANIGGFDADIYIEDYVKPALRDRMIKDLVEERTPKSSLGYVFRSAIDKSLLGKTGQLITDNAFGLGNYSILNSEGLENYNANRLEDLFSGVGSLVVDAPLFSYFGLGSARVVGGLTKMATERVASRVLANQIGKGMTREYARSVAERAIINKLSTKIMQSALVQGGTLGTYDLANSVVDDIIYNGNVDLSKAFSSFGKGFSTGAALGSVGTPLRHVSAGLSGGKKFLASTGIISAESAIFSTASEFERLANGVEIAPVDLLYDYGESAATLGLLKLNNLVIKGASIKLGTDGRLKKELQFTKSEKAELKELEIEPEEFIAKIEKELKLPSYFKGDNLEAIKENYIKLMSSNRLSASTRAKLMFVVENRLTSTPPIPFSYSVEKNKDGGWLLTTYDFEGQKIERMPYEHSGLVMNKLLVEKSKIRNNRILAYERELTHGVESQNFIRQAGVYAKENNVAVHDMAEILYKKAAGKELAKWESYVVDEVLKRSSYDKDKISEMLFEKRHELENKHGLKEDSMMEAAEKPFYLCSDAENKALDEYLSFVEGEVELLKRGVDNARNIELMHKERKTQQENIVNDGEEMKVEENSLENKPTAKSSFKGYVWPIQIRDDRQSEYVWNYNNCKNTPADIERYREHAIAIAERYGYKIDFITNEREIPLPDPDDIIAVKEYNNRIMSSGWAGKGKVTLNLPNLESIEDVESTMVHEVVGHDGLKRLFGHHLNDFLEEVYKKANGEVLEGIMNMKWKYREFNSYVLVEEYLAHLVEKVKPTYQERNLIVKFKNFIKEMLLKLNIYTGKNRRIGEKELDQLMRRHLEYMAKQRNPESYRKKVFGKFESSRFNKKSYYDRSVYDEGQRKKAETGSILDHTPEFMREWKKFMNYEFLPEDMKKECLEKWNVTEEYVLDCLKDYKYRFVGEKGAGNIAYYEGIEGGDPELTNAMELEKQGYSPEKIKMETGWERGADSKWRMEMTDKDLQVRDYMYDTLARKDRRLAEKYLALKEVPFNEWGKEHMELWNDLTTEARFASEEIQLSDVIYDPSFNKAYPELMSLPVEIVVNPDVPVRYDSKNKRIVIDRSIFVHPKGAMYMSGALQNLIQDYEGFSKAVSLNLMGINSKLMKRYSEAMKIVQGIDAAKEISPDFDRNSALEYKFMDEYGFTPEEFKKRFPTFDEYMIYRLTGKNISFSGDVEQRNVMNRFMLNDNFNRMIPAESTEDIPRSHQIPIERIGDLTKYFNGPLDIINEKMLELHSDAPLNVTPGFKRPQRSHLSPYERGDYEIDFDNYYRDKLFKKFWEEYEKKREEMEMRKKYFDKYLKKFKDMKPESDEDGDVELLN